MADIGVGETLRGYRIEAEIGRGGMGVVYRATQEQLGRAVALKVIKPESAGDESFRRRFKRESRLAASIEHPHAVPIYEAGETDETVYIAMRLIEGTDLRALLAERQWLEPAEAAALIDEVAGALDEAHSKGLIHRDVKPANVLIGTVRGERWAYLTDFGLTRRQAGGSKLTETGEWLGTLDYASPEQITGGKLDARADIYALGCVLFEAITGEVPFNRDDQVATLYAHVNDPPPLVSERIGDAPKELDAVIERALAKDPDDRFPSAGDLGRAAVAAAAASTATQPERSVAAGRAASGAETPGTASALGSYEDGARTEVIRSRRRAGRLLSPRFLIPAAALAAVLAALVILVLPGRGSDPKVTATVKVGERPSGMGFGNGLVWVTNLGDNTVSRIRPEAAEALTPIRIDGRHPSGITVNDGSAWVVSSRSDDLTRINAKSGGIVGRPTPVGKHPSGVRTGGGSVWVTNFDDNTLTRIDSESGDPIGGPIAVGHKPLGVAVGERSVWVANLGDRTVSRLDAKIGVPNGPRIGVGGQPRAVAYGESYVWVTNASSNSVTRIDASTGQRVGRPIAVGDRPSGITVAFGYVWVANQHDGTVSRIDASSGEVVGDPIDVGERPLGIAAGADAIWVANSFDGTVSRIEP